MEYCGDVVQGKNHLEPRPIDGGVADFLKEYGSVVNKATNEVYRAYHEHCTMNDIKPISNIEFSKQVKRSFGVNILDKKINSMKRRIFSW
jgi:hypothetical protein